ncbi:NAD(+) diphosphatase [Litorivicinus sp.]|nr:NAD(+) diphosphatase [Litorivicinus sp.]MDC1207703.1 NAD(+) diphosphatase [Litorivicinus sp.]MDC1240406.1 NAD(+) diphosphatase [Litorivicinus sp.]
MRWLGDHAIRWMPGESNCSNTLCLIVTSDRLVAVDSSGLPLKILPNDPRIRDRRKNVVGTINDILYKFVCLEMPSSDFEYELLRPVLIRLNSEEFIPLNAAMQVMDFMQEHRYCGSCGDKTHPSKSDRGLICQGCGHASYPRISPCVIILITREREILLGRSPRFIEGMYSTLAGFIEAGESAEHACHREIFEEVGVEINAPIYQGSQNWPFKHSLMLGYRAEWKKGDISVDGIEIVDAQWFSIDALPKLPPKASISRGMIDQFLSEQNRLN